MPCSDLKLHFWELPVVLRQNIGEAVERVVNGDPGPKGAADLLLISGQLGTHLRQLPGCRFAALKDGLSIGRKSNALMAAEQELDPQLPFDSFDPFGQGGLGDKQLFRGLCDIFAFPQNLQQFKILFVHVGTPLRRF